MTVRIDTLAQVAGWISAEAAHKEAETVHKEAKAAVEELAIKMMPRIMTAINKTSKNGCFYVAVNFTHNFDVNIAMARLLEELGYKVKFLRHGDSGSIYEINW